MNSFGYNHGQQIHGGDLGNSLSPQNPQPQTPTGIPDIIFTGVYQIFAMFVIIKLLSLSELYATHYSRFLRWAFNRAT